MKKFISMVMAAAMVVSLVPATAFAANVGSFKVVGAQKVTKTAAADMKAPEGNVTSNGDETQIQIVMKDVDTVRGVQDDYKITLDYDGIEATRDAGNTGWSEWAAAGVYRNTTGASDDVGTKKIGTVAFKGFEAEDTTVELKITEVAGYDFEDGDIIVLPIDASWGLSKASEGTVATVAVSGDFGESDDMTVVSVLGQALDITVAGKPTEIPQEEKSDLKAITIETVTGSFTSTDKIKVKLNKGFEFSTYPLATTAMEDYDNNFFEATFAALTSAGFVNADGDIVFPAKSFQIEAVSAKPGDVATLTVSCKNYDSATDDAAIVIADGVTMTVDEDEDVPVFYNGVDAANTGLTDTEDHKALEVTIKESVKDSWDGVKAWNLELPEGVYVTAVDAEDNGEVESYKEGTIDDAFAKAYKDGDYEGFEFGRRAIVLDKTAKSEIKFTLTLVAEPTFTGDVTLTLTGDAFDKDQEVVIANFVSPVTVEAKQNDMVIDYKETVVPTSVVLKEAEEGLWSKDIEDVTTVNKDGDEVTKSVDSKYALYVEKIEVENADITVDDESGMEIKVKDETFTVKEESDDAAAAVTMDKVALYMSRDIPAGTYDLELTTPMYKAFLMEPVYAGADDVLTVRDVMKETNDSYAVKEGWVNVITSGRDKDDASFTTKVVVPVGESYLIANEQTVALDVPAYINANGYTMLPVRAVAVALGIDTNNVLWNQPTKTVTILYGQRIITMTAGQKVVNVNGSALPATAAVEIVNGRTFLGMRDLATALGVTDITWDAATQTATLNGNK